jgi:phosphatidylglycerophosphate synthase
MSHDTIVHAVVRPAVRLIAKTPIVPDHLTILRFLSGVAAAVAFARGDILPGSFIFIVSCLLDRADGELARQTQRFSQHGHRYDIWADWSAGALTFIGLGIGALHGPLGLAAPILGVLSAVGTTALYWSINVLQAHKTLPHVAAATGRVLVDPDDGMFVIPPLLWLFGAPGVLLPAGMATPVLAAVMIQRMIRAQANLAAERSAPNPR